MKNSAAAECLDTLQGLTTEPGEAAYAVLSQMVERVRKSRQASARQLEVLEAMRHPLARVQARLAGRYADHPLPPDSAENRTFIDVVSLWQRMAQAYAHLLSLDVAEGLLHEQRGQLWQRCLYYAARALLEHFRAHRMVAPGHWAQLHDSYAAAEQQAVVDERVAEPLNPVWQAQSPREAYIAALLVDLANPFGRNPREFDWICRWAERFAPCCSLVEAAGTSAESGKAAAYGLDLSRDYGLRPVGKLAGRPAGQLRHFDGARLASQIRAILSQLKSGRSPQELGLGADCPVDAGAQLLLSLYRPWGLAAAGRRYRRQHFDGTARLSVTWPDIAELVHGKPLTPRVEAAPQRSHHSDMSLLTFGERAPSANPPHPGTSAAADDNAASSRCEGWSIVDQSVSGFKLCRSHPQNRLSHRQLIGIRPPDGAHFLLGLVSWLMYRNDGVLEAGIALMPGMPKLVAVRPRGPGKRATQEYQQAFVLPALSALRQPASLVARKGRYRAHQTLEGDPREAGTPGTLRLTDILRRGADFEQFAFEPVRIDA